MQSKASEAESKKPPAQRPDETCELWQLSWRGCRGGSEFPIGYAWGGLASGLCKLEIFGLQQQYASGCFPMPWTLKLRVCIHQPNVNTCLIGNHDLLHLTCLASGIACFLRYSEFGWARTSLISGGSRRCEDLQKGPEILALSILNASM